MTISNFIRFFSVARRGRLCVGVVLAALALSPHQTAIAGGLPVMPYDQVPFANSWCGCDPGPDGGPKYSFLKGGCCIGAGAVFTSVTRGGDPYQLAYGKDNLEKDYYLGDLYDLIAKDGEDSAALPHMDEALVNVIGMANIFFAQAMDAQNLQTALNAIQRANIQTFRDTSLSEEVCRFGSLTYGLAKSQDISTATQQNLATRSLHRQMMRQETSPAKTDIAASTVTFGTNADKTARLDQITAQFCDLNDNKNALKTMCGANSDMTLNRDLDYARVIDEPLTLQTNLHLPGSGPSTDDKNVMALESNLYGHELMMNLTPSDLEAIRMTKSEEALKKFFHHRSLTAKRSVAVNTYAAIAALKANGSGGTPYDATNKNSFIFEKAIMKELGLSDDSKDDHTKKYLAGGVLPSYGERPSYYAQMEVMTKKQFQTSKFYDNLMDSPANNARKQAAIKALALTQDRDIFESLRRSELLMSTLLELHIQNEQDTWTDKGRR